jgi:hypothetical protein
LSTNPYLPPQANLDTGVRSDATPLIWNPGAAVAWSLLFSPIFGALVHMNNWEAMGKPEQAERSKRWAIGCFLLFIAMLAITIAMPESRLIDSLTTLGGFGLLIAWYAASARDQIQFVTDGHGKDYVRRGWGKPLLYGVLVYVGVIVVGIVISVISAVAAGEA